MKILYIAHSFGAWGSPDRIWDYNLRDSLIQMGHEVIAPLYDANRAQIDCTHDPSGEARARYSDLLVRSVEERLKKGPLDLIFTYFDNRNVLPAALDEVRRHGVPTVNFFCNAVHEFHKIDRVAAHFDYCMVPERAALATYREAGARPVRVPLAANPRFYRPLPVLQTYDLTFIGTRYLNREEHLLRLHQAGIELHVFGEGWQPYRPALTNASFAQLPRRIAGLLLWPMKRAMWAMNGRQLPYRHIHPPLSDEALLRIFSQSRISLGLSDVLDQSGKILRHIRLRDFEAPMCRAFTLTGYQEELGEFYEIGQEIECYAGIDELAEKARFYLRHPESREKIRQAGRRRARKEHTWENRFQKLFQEIGLAVRA
jgi:hypothetical protein